MLTKKCVNHIFATNRWTNLGPLKKVHHIVPPSHFKLKTEYLILGSLKYSGLNGIEVKLWSITSPFTFKEWNLQINQFKSWGGAKQFLAFTQSTLKTLFLRFIIKTKRESPDSFQTLRTSYRLSGQFPDFPDSFYTVQLVAKLSGYVFEISG